MELNKNFNRDNYDDEDDIKDIDQDYLTSLDISLPYSTNASKYDSFGGDYGEKCKPSTSKISMISDTQSTENFLKEFDCFYAEMMGKVKGLKDTPALKNTTCSENLEEVEEKLFKNLKDTPEVQEQIKHIRRLDADIKNVLSEYKFEREERLQTQHEMCTEIAKNNTLPERDTELFLNLCQFEFSDDESVNKIREQHTAEEKKNLKCTDGDKKPNNFITRNIFLAKEGVFANSSLTDEEKFKLECLLQENECESQTKPKNPFTIPNGENTFKNGYKFTENDKKKVEEIDSELEKFKLDEKTNEKDINSTKNDETYDVDIRAEIEKLNNFMLEQRLKRLEAKLKTLQQTEEKELEDFRTKIKEKTEDVEANPINIEELTMIKEDAQDSEEEIEENEHKYDEEIEENEHKYEKEIEENEHKYNEEIEENEHRYEEKKDLENIYKMKKATDNIIKKPYENLFECFEQEKTTIEMISTTTINELEDCGGTILTNV